MAGYCTAVMRLCNLMHTTYESLAHTRPRADSITVRVVRIMLLTADYAINQQN